MHLPVKREARNSETISVLVRKGGAGTLMAGISNDPKENADDEPVEGSRQKSRKKQTSSRAEEEPMIDCRADLREVVAEAVEKISEEFRSSKDRTEDTLVSVVEANLTGNLEADEVILQYARHTLLNLRERSVEE